MTLRPLLDPLPALQLHDHATLTCHQRLLLQVQGQLWWLMVSCPLVMQQQCEIAIRWQLVRELVQVQAQVQAHQ